MVRDLILGKYHSHYEYIYHSPEWRQKKKEAYEMARKMGRYYCVVCWSPKNLVLNHMHYESIGKEDIWTDLNWMCKACHHNFHFDFWGKKQPFTRYAMRRRLHILIFRRALRQTLLFPFTGKLRPAEIIWYGILSLLT